ncbi:MAG TPA: lysozyme [Caulobacteraceae bacterium]|nr:lysozyme [Caulobacteraceae bacterium]
MIKRFEGFRRSAAQLPDGRWTIGYGHSRSAREGAQVSEDDASALLLYDLGEITLALNELIFTPLNQNQFDAIASFAMNIGLEEFRGSSVLLRLNEGSMLQAASAIELWRRADFEGERIVVDALVRRRAAEKALFLTPADGYVPTPTPVVRPRIDYTAAEPVAEAVELTAPLEGDIAIAQRERDQPGAEMPQPDAPTADMLEVEALEFDAAELAAEGEAGEAGEALPTPTEFAAQSVNARLQKILDDLDLVESTPQLTPEVEPAPVDTPTIERPFILPLSGAAPHTLRLLEETRVDPFPSPPAPVQIRDSLVDDAPSPAALLGDESPSTFAEPIGRPSFDVAAIERSPVSYVALAFMLLVGVALLAAATYWFVHAHPGMGALTPSVIGWALGLAGVSLLAGSIYFLLSRIGGQDDAR